MIRLTTNLALSAADAAELQRLQAAVNACGDYSAQVIEADAQWGTKSRALFKRIRKALAAECPGVERCCYCEDSRGDEIEHIRPKNWFPDQVFDSNNYLFSCGPCNGPKSNAYAVVAADGTLLEAKRGKGDPVCAPPAGQEALLHPRLDDPTAFFELDLYGTFRIDPQPALDSVGEERAKYTIRVLRLNEEFPRKCRAKAFVDFNRHLEAYIRALEKGEPDAKLKRRRHEILERQHIYVWREMQRQAPHTSSLKALFGDAPGADQW